MPTATSWTETFLGPLRDTRSLVAFRRGAVTQKRRLLVVLAAMVLLTLAVAVVPAFLPGAAEYDSGEGYAFQMFLLLPSAYAGFLVLAAVSAVASGGGRELVPRDQAVAWPISPAVDHLGALLMAPLNIAWLLQGWLVLGATSYVVGPGAVAFAEVIAVLWLFLATATAQIVAWSMEALRRGPHGIGVVRGIVAVLGALVVGLILAGKLSAFLDRLPTLWLVNVLAGLTQGFTVEFPLTVLLLVALLFSAVLIGILPARAALSRSPRDEARIETGTYPARRNLRSDLLSMMRIDRVGVWRAVSLRRGILLLAAAPGLIALAGSLEWQMLTILPGLVASGATLLFGVNAWCLDGRGALWRDSLPADPSITFLSRTLVLLELLLMGSAVTVLLAVLRAGPPTASQVSALVCAWLVVSVQVVSLSMRWSVSRPFSVDLRSARATPAPPVVMVGYSTRLAVSTTIVGLMFSGLAQLPDWRAPVLLAVPLLVFSLLRLVRVHGVWIQPVQRSFVVATVAA